MSKYIKLNDALEGECILDAVYEDCEKCPLYKGKEQCKLGEWLCGLPTIDIVHCKDCIRFDGEDCCERIGMILYPEDVERHFCGYGERIEQ